MNKRSKLFLVCGFALAMMIVSAQQTVKADEATDAQVTAVDTDAQANDTAAISQATQTDPQATTADNEQDNADAVTTDQTATTQADAASQSVTHIKGIVTTKDQVTYLYAEDGSQVKGRALRPNTAWITDRKLDNNDATYYRVATNEYANSGDVTLSYGYSDSGVIRVKQDGAVSYSRGDQGFYRNGQANYSANSIWKYNRQDNSDDLTYYQIANNVWVNSNDATPAPVYQNPNGWLQIQNTQIKPVGTVGYDLYNGVEGIKTWYVRRYFGYSNAHTVYDSSVAASVRSLQSRKGLPVTGVVNLATWEAMGLSKDTWYGIDSYVAPLRTNLSSTRADHIEAMINEAYRYLGQPWISGAASSPNTGVDCSGLVTQSLYASGIDSAPISAIQHAQPGNEWNCQMYWNDDRIPHVAFNDRQRGDLIFFTDPSSGMLWHVGILLNPTTMIESWPYAVQVHSIYSGRGNIAGVKRVFA